MTSFTSRWSEFDVNGKPDLAWTESQAERQSLADFESAIRVNDEALSDITSQNLRRFRRPISWWFILGTGSSGTKRAQSLKSGPTC